MNMISICANLQELELVSLLNFQANLFQYLINFTVKDGSSILSWKYQVVHQYRNVMTLMNIFAHPTILRRKRRGIEPQGIKKYGLSGVYLTRNKD